MKYQLTATEARVIGCLLEKQVTTPDQYPMSLNSLTLACNQKTNREPVMSLTEQEVQHILDTLVKRHFLRTVSGFGNRVTKYEQRFCNSEFGQLTLTPSEVAIITTLLLRGAQTPGELRGRCSRMFEFTDMAQLDETLNGLLQRDAGPLIYRSAREPGKRESRYLHLFTDDIPPASDALAENMDESPDLQQRVETLERELADLKRQFAVLLASVEH